MELTVYWTEFAENKLEKIFYFYKKEAGFRIAQKLVNGIIDKTIDLGKNPNIGQKEALLAGFSQEFRYLVFKNYKVIYWINTTKHRVEIANVFDCRQDPSRMNEIK